MTPQQSKKLDESIEHWTRIVEGQTHKHECIGSGSCALCIEFNSTFHAINHVDTEDTCRGCPVMQKTGQKYCYATPYTKCEELWKGEASLRDYIFIEAAKKELDFLISLREQPPLCHEANQTVA